MKTIIIHSENKNHLQNLLVELSNDFRKSDCKLFLHSKNYIPWSDDFIKNDIISYQEYYAYQTHKDPIDSVIELVLKSKTDDIVIIDENPNTNKFIGKKSDFLKSNLDTKYKSLDWFLVDVNTQIDNRRIPMYFFIPHQPNEDSQRYFKKIDNPLFNDRIIYIDGGLGDHIMALPLLEKLQNDIHICCKYPFIFEHLNVKGYVNWFDDLFGGYSRFVYEYGSSNNINTIIDAFFGLYGEIRTKSDLLVYNGKRSDLSPISNENSKIALICTSAAKIQNQDSNKDWKDVRWMNLVHQLKKDNYFVIQVGTSKDNQIPNVNLKFLDRPIPELAWLIDNSSLWLSVDTFFHHFAAAIKPEVGICLTPFYNDHAKHPKVTYVEKDCGKNYWDRRWWLDLQQPERKECMDLIQVEDVLIVIKKKIKVKIYYNNPNYDNCSNWRGHMQYNDVEGLDVEFSTTLDFDINKDKNYQVVVMIRPLKGLVNYVKTLQENSVRVVVDFDDSLPFIFDPKTVVSDINEALQIMSQADLVTTTNEKLKSYYYYHTYNENIVVLPNIIDPKFVSETKKNNGEKIVLGWFGNSGHIDNLRLINKVVLKILDEYENVYLNVYSDTKEIFDLLDHPKTNKINYQFDFNKFQESIGDIDINLAPLEESYFSLHKSNIRLLLTGYKNIPSIASNFGEYKSMGKENVILCDTENEWYDGLVKLIKDEKFRIEIGQNIKKYINKNYLFDNWKKNKYEIISNLVK